MISNNNSQLKNLVAHPNNIAAPTTTSSVMVITEKANKSANFQIQRIAKALEFPIHISFHLSRHSFATNALNNGMRIEHVSKLMDHQDIRTTQIYAKIINEELDKAVDEFIF